ncbi:MAG: prepilin-type N-terminal cleavage/methylation domain-containing protein [Planctomycetes bacterium]|nr:prepilin-type N-terminal cleavage/methylation domain-containing protein [Planctomycetota bacterium]
MSRTNRGLTLIEIMVIVAIIGLLVAIAVPSMGHARQQSRALQCMTNLHTLGQGWRMYSDENGDVVVPARMPFFQSGGFSNTANQYSTSTGLKYRPRWPALLQKQVGVPAFIKPRTDRDRQNYDSPVYVCPSASEWTDERNASYGYNYQFLGSQRKEKGQDGSRKMTMLSKIKKSAGTLVIADSMGSAAAFPTRERLPYENATRDEHRRGNYGWLIDPPKLEAKSSRAGGPRSKRSAADARHHDKVNAVFVDGHAQAYSLRDLGYDVQSDGHIPDTGRNATNKMFSGSGEDERPP